MGITSFQAVRVLQAQGKTFNTEQKGALRAIERKQGASWKVLTIPKAKIPMEREDQGSQKGTKLS